jgi:hypothetical protein
MPEPRRPSAVRTYGSKPRKVSTTHLWDGTRDVPRRVPLGDNTATQTNERKQARGLGGFVKGVVDWLSPRKSRQTVSRKLSGKENSPSRQSHRVCLDDDDDDDDNADVSIASTENTLVASTPKKDHKATPEPKTGLGLLLQFCVKDSILDFSEYIAEQLTTANVIKLGEASFSEVFTIKHQDGRSTVLKIVPFNDTVEDKDHLTSNLGDILQELRISNVMANVDGFADFQGYLGFYFRCLTTQGGCRERKIS